MAEPDVFQLADRALARVVAQIEPDQWDMILPASFATRRRPEPPSLRELVNYHAYDDAWVPDMLAGLTMDEAGSDQFDGDLLGERPAASFEAIVERACAAAATVTDLDADGAPLVRRLHGARVLLADQPVPRVARARHRPGDRRGP